MRIRIAPMVTIERLIVIVRLADRGERARVLAPGDAKVDAEREGRAERDHDRADVEPDDDVVERDGERLALRRRLTAARVGTAAAAPPSRPRRRPRRPRVPAAASAARHPVDLGGQQARADQRAAAGASMRPATSSSSGAVRLATTVGAARRGLLAQVDPFELQLDPVCGGVLRRRLERGRLAVAADHRPPAELRGRDREHARAGPEVGERAARRAARRRARAAARGTASSSRARRSRTPARDRRRRYCPATSSASPPGVPGRRRTGSHEGRTTIRPPATATGSVEVAPAVGPVVGDLGRADLDQARRRPPPPGRGAPGSRRAGRRSRTRPTRRPRSSSTPPGRQLEQLREHPLGELRAAADREPDHSRLPSSDSCSWRARSRCLRESLRGTTTSTTTCSSPRPRAAERRQAEALEGDRVAGLRAGGDLDLALALERRHRDLAADHRQGRRHPGDRDQVLAAALEALVLGDRDDHVEVARAARRPRRRGRRPRSGSAGPTRSPAGPRRPRCARGRSRPAPSQRSQGCSATCPAPPQVGQAHGLDELAEGGAAHLLHAAGAAAGLAGVDRRPGLGAVAVAALAGRDGLEVDLRAGRR